MAAFQKALSQYSTSLRAEDMSPIDRITAWFKTLSTQDYDGHDSALLKLLTPTSLDTAPTPGNPNNSVVVFTLTVPRTLCNITGNLHGGAVALIFDITTSTAITAVSKEGSWDTGHVSRTLNCTYLRPVPAGANVTIISRVVSLGKRLALTTGEIMDEKGRVCYTCDHGKVAIGASTL